MTPMLFDRTHCWLLLVTLLGTFVCQTKGEQIKITHDLPPEVGLQFINELSSFDSVTPTVLTVDKREASINAYNADNHNTSAIESQQTHLLSIEDNAMECIFVRSEEGVYRYWKNSTSVSGPNEVCGLYVIAHPDQMIQFEFEHLNVSCNGDNALSVVDGWELNGQLFPASIDHPLEKSKRFTFICGDRVKPQLRTIRLSQNVALLQFRIRQPGQGFQVRVRFLTNSMPCNAVFQLPQGVHTLRNFGKQRNCSVSILFPQSVRILSASFGLKSVKSIDTQMSPINQSANESIATTAYNLTSNASQPNPKPCPPHNSDYIQLLGGDGLDTGLMKVASYFCPAIIQSAITSNVKIACGNTAVRLVSSGLFDNSVTIAFQLLLEKSGQDSFVCSSTVSIK